jgi:hypothetical protein
MRKLAWVAIAAAVSLGTFGYVSAASASGGPVTATGALSSATVTGTITFSPALTESGSSTASLTYDPQNCTTMLSNVIVNRGVDIIRMYPGSTFGTPLGAGYINTWTGIPGNIAPTNISISGSQFITTESGDVGIMLQGTATGSFAGSAEVTLNSNLSVSAFDSELDSGGVSSLTFTSGSTMVGTP